MTMTLSPDNKSTGWALMRYGETNMYSLWTAHDWGKHQAIWANRTIPGPTGLAASRWICLGVSDNKAELEAMLRVLRAGGANKLEEW